MSCQHACLLPHDIDTLKSVANAGNESGQTLLIRSIFIDNDDLRKRTFEILLQVGANPWVSDIYHRNTLMWACLFRRDREIHVLLETVNSMDLLQTDIHGNTALHLAVTSGSAASVKHILDCMAVKELPTDTENNFGITPCMQAQRLGFDVCYKLLTNDQESNTMSHMPLKRNDSDTSLSSSDSGSYRHCKRQMSSGASSVSSLPPIFSTDVTRKMNSLDMNAVCDSFDKNPFNFLEKICNKKSKKATAAEPHTQLPSLTASSNRKTKFKPSTCSLPEIDISKHTLS